MYITCMLALQPVVHLNLRKLMLETLHKQTEHPVLGLVAFVDNAHGFLPCLVPGHLLVVFEASGHHA